jgi:hypothetical protein
MDGNNPGEKAHKTANYIVEKAFGDKYLAWNNIPSEKIVLTEEEEKKLASLIEDRDHYEIKETIRRHIKNNNSIELSC